MLLLLDEPTAHLDLRYQVETVALLRRLNRESDVTIVLVTHDLNLAAELADRVLLLSRGRVHAIGSPDQVIREETISAIYGCPVHVEPNPESGRPHLLLRWPREEVRR